MIDFQKYNCIDCKFGDRKALLQQKPCCTYPGRIELNESGNCLTAKKTGRMKGEK